MFVFAHTLVHYNMSCAAVWYHTMTLFTMAVIVTVAAMAEIGQEALYLYDVVRSDLETHQFQLTLFGPHISARARYRSSGVLLLVRASGGGEYWGEYGKDIS
ncbi:unnamed protein product [Chrysodeixis includens]|uniref:Uncharacterized protein n=1 Tax=Chrysodeixis includens TaxID=689277 RepID=A0A9P0BWX9_CHRIL|nr:unnamed protein product [Chrysodeixis includens]